MINEQPNKPEQTQKPEQTPADLQMNKSSKVESEKESQGQVPSSKEFVKPTDKNAETKTPSIN